MALVLNGTNQYARANLTSSVNADAASSIAVTFKTGSVVSGVVQTVAALNSASGYFRGYKVIIRADGYISVVYNATGADSQGSSPWLNTVAAPNTIYRLVITKANGATGNITAYLDTIAKTYTRAVVASGNTLTRISLGAALGSSPEGYFGGKVVRAAFWPSVLSTADINVCLNSATTPNDCAVAPQDYWQAVSDDLPTIGSNSLTRFNSAVYDSETLTSPSIATMNSGNPVQYGQTGVTVTAVAFSGLPTSGTVTHAGGTLTMSNFAGTASSFTYDLQDRSEGTDWPLDGESCTFTFNYSSESASITRTVSKKTGEEKLTFASADTANTNSLAYHLNAAGFTVNGGEIVFAPYSNLDLDPENDGTTDGNYTVTGDGSFPSWFRPSTGTGAGNVYYFNWTISSGAVVVDTTPDAFTFGSQTNVELTAITEGSVQAVITGVTADTDIEAVPSGGLECQVSSDGGTTFGSWTDEPFNVQLGYVIEGRILSSSFHETLVTGSLTIGSTVGTLSVTTRASSDIPDPLVFASFTNSELLTEHTSSTQTVTGLDSGESSAFTVANGTYSKNGGAFISTPGTMEPDDTFALRGTSDEYFGRSKTVTLTATNGSVESTFTIINKLDPLLPASIGGNSQLSGRKITGRKI